MSDDRPVVPEPEPDPKREQRAKGAQSMHGVPSAAERSIRMRVRRWVDNPDEFHAWARREILLQAGILAYKARNSDAIEDCAAAVKAFNALVLPILKGGKR